MLRAVGTRHHEAKRIRENPDVDAARRDAEDLARTCGLDARYAARTGLIVQELGTNLVRHAGGGHILLRPDHESGTLEVLALDSGPGLPAWPPERGMLLPGQTGLGAGLGAVRRFATTSALFGEAGTGTAVLVRMGHPIARMAAGVAVPVGGTGACGDAWKVIEQGPRTAILAVDGLGHGAPAQAAAEVALESFDHVPDRVDEMMGDLHRRLRHTRGVAAFLAVVDHGEEALDACGVGNLRAALHGPDGTRPIIPRQGIVGYHTWSQPRAQRLPATDQDVLLVTSDGTERAARSLPDGLSGQDAALVAGWQWMRSAHGRDDSLVVAANCGRLGGRT